MAKKEWPTWSLKSRKDERRYCAVVDSSLDYNLAALFNIVSNEDARIEQYVSYHESEAR